MAVTVRRRGYGEDSVYFDAANNRWTGAVSLSPEIDGRPVVAPWVFCGEPAITARKTVQLDLRPGLDRGAPSGPTSTAPRA